MTLSRAFRKAIGRLLIGVLLFAQFAVAGYACPGLSGMGMSSMPKADDVMAMASDITPEAAVSAASAQMPPGCNQIDPNAVNLCLEHCRHGQQSADTVLVPVVLAAIPTFLYSLPLEPAPLLGSGRPAPAVDVSLAAAPPPPHAILHCVFRI